MKLLLIIAAVIEAVAGLTLLLLPTVAVAALLGVPLDTPTGLVAARIAGAALVGLAIACWQAKNGERGSLATGVVEAMSFYNFAGAMVLVYAGIRLDFAQCIAMAGDRFASGPRRMVCLESLVYSQKIIKV